MTLSRIVYSIHLFSTVLGAKNRAVNETKFFSLMELIFYGKTQADNQVCAVSEVVSGMEQSRVERELGGAIYIGQRGM